MKRWLWLLMIVPAWVGADEGSAVYEAKCAECHVQYVDFERLQENFMQRDNQLLKLKAPTINQLAFRLKQRIGDPSGDAELHLMEVTEFVRDYLMEPDRAKSVCMPEVMVHFETMPSMKGKIGDEAIDAVSSWIYHFEKPIEKQLRFLDLDAALKRANAEGKIVMIEATSPTCHYCVRMENMTFKEKEVVAAVEKDFLPVKVDVSRSRLPEGLSWGMTPTFFFLDGNSRLIKKIPGSWNKEDFLQILKEVKEKQP